MLKDYTDDSMLITADRTITGLGQLREAFTAFFAGLFAPGTYEFTLEAELSVGEGRRPLVPAQSAWTGGRRRGRGVGAELANA